VHLFDFDERIYSRRITVQFLEKLREEQKFSDLDTLTEQIRRDAVAAREYFLTAKTQSTQRSK